MEPEKSLATATRYIPLTQWNKHHPWPTTGSLRWLVFNAKTNGFDRVIKRVQHRVLVDEAAFFAWVESQNQGGGI
jgi:hypothetical protein